MGVGWGMAGAWMRAIRERYKAKQTMAHLSRNRWKYLGKRIHQGGRGLNQTGGFAGIMAGWLINKIHKKIQGGSGKVRKETQKGLRKQRKRIRRQTHILLKQ